MKLSLVLPTHRSDNVAVARIIEWASIDIDNFEFIVRDNSGCDWKANILTRIQSNCMKLCFVDNCSMTDNILSALALATGEFVFFVGDDDWISTRGLLKLVELASGSEVNRSVSCLIGDYLVDNSNYGSGIFRYSGLASESSTSRVRNYLDFNAPNYLNYCAARYEYVNLVISLFSSFPYNFSFDDQLVSLLYLTLGKVSQVERIVYGYDLSEWDTAEKSLAKDRSFYVSAGLPAEYDRLHHLLLGLQGALLLDSNLISERIDEDASQTADLWFSTMYSKFLNHNREFGYLENSANDITRKLKEKLIKQRDIDINELLLDVCEAFEVCDPIGAQRYFRFWSSL